MKGMLGFLVLLCLAVLVCPSVVYASGPTCSVGVTAQGGAYASQGSSVSISVTAEGMGYAYGGSTNVGVMATGESDD